MTKMYLMTAEVRRPYSNNQRVKKANGLANHYLAVAGGIPTEGQWTSKKDLINEARKPKKKSNLAQTG